MPKSKTKTRRTFTCEFKVADKRREELAGEIRTAHADVKRRYGSQRMHAELQARGHACSLKTVAKIMKGLGIQAISHRKFRVSTTDSNHDFPIAANYDRHADIGGLYSNAL